MLPRLLFGFKAKANIKVGGSDILNNCYLQNVLALEMPYQIVDNPWWPQLVKMTGKQTIY